MIGALLVPQEISSWKIVERFSICCAFYCKRFLLARAAPPVGLSGMIGPLCWLAALSAKGLTGQRCLARLTLPSEEQQTRIHPDITLNHRALRFQPYGKETPFFVASIPVEVAGSMAASVKPKTNLTEALYQIAHVFLPPQVPQQDDTNVFHEMKLMATVSDALRELRRRLPPGRTRELDGAIRLMENTTMARSATGMLHPKLLEERLLRLGNSGESSSLFVVRGLISL